MEQMQKYIEKYYPRNISTADNEYYNSKEFSNLQTLRENARLNNKRWLSLKTDLENLLPTFYFEDWSYLIHDAAFIGRLYLPESKSDEPIAKAIVICVSIIAPTYMIYYSEKGQKDGQFAPSKITFVPDELNSEVWYKVLECIQKSFSDFDLISQENAFQRITDFSVGNKPMNDTVVADFIFTDNMW